MTTEEKLKDLILARYYSIRDFTNSIELPYTTLDSMFRRGIQNSSVNNVIKVCKALGISADALADGEIVPISETKGKILNDRYEVRDVLDNTKEILTRYGFVTLDGKPIDKDGIESILDAMEVGIEIAKKKSKS